MTPYVPEAGHIVWLNFSTQAGHEQAGHRPALVLSPRNYNDATGLAVSCPVTSALKGYPFEVLLPHSGPVTGAMLADQVRSLDWRARRVVTAPHHAVREVREKLAPLIG